MQKHFHLALAAGEVFQLLDGLEIREKAWRDTAHFLTTGDMGDDFFLIEECSSPEEATNIAEDYRTIIDRINKQITAQKATNARPEYLTRPKQGTAVGYAIYIDTFFTGPIPVERNDANLPAVYSTEVAAQREIAEYTITRLQQFLAGERDFEDAITIEEYIRPVDLHPDGSITDSTKNRFPNDTW